MCLKKKKWAIILTQLTNGGNFKGWGLVGDLFYCGHALRWGCESPDSMFFFFFSSQW